MTVELKPVFSSWISNPALTSTFTKEVLVMFCTQRTHYFTWFNIQSVYNSGADKHLDILYVLHGLNVIINGRYKM